MMLDILEKVEIYEVTKGKVTKLKYKNKIINVLSIEEMEISTEEPEKISEPKAKQTKQTEQTTLDDFQWDLGEPIGQANHNTVYSNPTKWLKEHPDAKSKEVYRAFRKFYKDRKPKKSSISTYISSHRKFSGLQKRTTSPTALSKYGEIIAHVDGVAIHKDAIDKINRTGKTKSEIKRVLKSFYKDTKLSTRETYLRGYIKYVNGEGNIVKAINKKPGRRKPDSVVGYSQKYKTWISKDDYLAVKRAINKWNFEATSFNIADETKLSLQKVRATIDVLKKLREIYVAYKDATPVYKKS